MDIATTLEPYLKDVAVLTEQANTFKIESVTDYEMGAWFIRDRKIEIDSIEKDAEPIKDAAHKLHAMICDKIREGVWPRKHMITVVKDRMLTWKKKADLARSIQQQKLIDESVASGDMTPVILQEVKVDGVTPKKRWRGRVLNKRDLIKAIVANPGLMDSVKVDQSWLDNYVNEHDGKVVIPGVEPYEEEKIDIRADRERKSA